MENAFKNTFIVKIIWSKTPAQEWRYSVRLLTFSKIKNTGLVKTNRSAHGQLRFFFLLLPFFFPKAFAEGGITDIFDDCDEEEGEEKDEGSKGEDAGEGVDDAGWENESDGGRRRQVSCEFGPWYITKLGIVLEEHVRLVGCQYPHRVLNCSI